MRIQIHKVVHSYMIKNVHSYIDIYKEQCLSIKAQI